jgi:hypothetical protein
MLNRRTGYQGNQQIQQKAIVMRRWIRATCRAASHGYVKRAEPPACLGHGPSPIFAAPDRVRDRYCNVYDMGNTSVSNAQHANNTRRTSRAIVYSAPDYRSQHSAHHFSDATPLIAHLDCCKGAHLWLSAMSSRTPNSLEPHRVATG